MEFVQALHVQPVLLSHKIAQNPSSFLNQLEQAFVFLRRCQQKLHGLQSIIKEGLNFQWMTMDPHAPINHEATIGREHGGIDFKAIAQRDIENIVQALLKNRFLGKVHVAGHLHVSGQQHDPRQDGIHRRHPADGPVAKIGIKFLMTGNVSDNLKARR